MATSGQFRRIVNKDIQSLMNIKPRQAGRLLKRIRKRFNKEPYEPIYLAEFCAVTKLPIDEVGAFLDSNNTNPNKKNN